MNPFKWISGIVGISEGWFLFHFLNSNILILKFPIPSRIGLEKNSSLFFIFLIILSTVVLLLPISYPFLTKY
jgi:hypothetical protein